MFNGIVEEIGTVQAVTRARNLAVLHIRARKVVGQTKPGDSICVDGVCLTVTAIHQNVLTFDVMR